MDYTTSDIVDIREIMDFLTESINKKLYFEIDSEKAELLYRYIKDLEKSNSILREY